MPVKNGRRTIAGSGSTFTCVHARLHADSAGAEPGEKMIVELTPAPNHVDSSMFGRTV
jgi:hypothetical protein